MTDACAWLAVLTPWWPLVLGVTLLIGFGLGWRWRRREPVYCAQCTEEVAVLREDV